MKKLDLGGHFCAIITSSSHLTLTFTDTLILLFPSHDLGKCVTPTRQSFRLLRQNIVPVIVLLSDVAQNCVILNSISNFLVDSDLRQFCLYYSTCVYGRERGDINLFFYLFFCAKQPNNLVQGSRCSVLVILITPSPGRCEWEVGAVFMRNAKRSCASS